jgi:hypothetical protein
LKYWDGVVAQREVVEFSRHILVKRRTKEAVERAMAPGDVAVIPGDVNIEQSLPVDESDGTSGDHLVGRRIMHAFTFMNRRLQFYVGTIKRWRLRKRPHAFVQYHVRFDDGEWHWLTLDPEGYHPTIPPTDDTQWCLLAEE